MPLGKEEIHRRWGFHGGSEHVAAQHVSIRAAFITFAEQLDEILPDGRTKDVAMDQLKTTSMWAHFALAEQAPVIQTYHATPVYSSTPGSASI